MRTCALYIDGFRPGTSCMKWRVPLCQWRTMATASASASAAPWQRHLKFMQPTQAEAVRAGRGSEAGRGKQRLLLSHMQMMFVDDPWKYSHTHTHTQTSTRILCDTFNSTFPMRAPSSPPPALPLSYPFLPFQQARLVVVV